MARQLRLHVPGGFYHVTLRGNHRQPIFFAEQDRELLDEIVSEVTAKLFARVHAYCWMTNHLHMLVQVSEAPLGQIVRQIASRYARTVQSRMATTGHLFERRYHCVLVDADSYLMTLVRYIHLNPVRAGLVTNPTSYQWSSHGVYLGSANRTWVSTGFLMRLLAPDPADALAVYCDLMRSDAGTRWGEGPLTPNPDYKNILGDADFAARICARSPKPRSPTGSLDELLLDCVERFGISLDQLVSPSKSPGLGVARAWVAHEAVGVGAATICAVARRLNRCESAIRQLMARYPREKSAV